MYISFHCQFILFLFKPIVTVMVLFVYGCVTMVTMSNSELWYLTCFHRMFTDTDTSNSSLYSLKMTPVVYTAGYFDSTKQMEHVSDDRQDRAQKTKVYYLIDTVWVIVKNSLVSNKQSVLVYICTFWQCAFLSYVQQEEPMQVLFVKVTLPFPVMYVCNYCNYIVLFVCLK